TILPRSYLTELRGREFKGIAPLSQPKAETFLQQKFLFTTTLNFAKVSYNKKLIESTLPNDIIILKPNLIDGSMLRAKIVIISYIPNKICLFEIYQATS
ncbi:MAG: hypothetical protein SPI30_10845, partial [Prevotella sp.]|nr:hypothetical protein [Prevotella sp.]